MVFGRKTRFVFHDIPAYFYMQRNSKDHYMQLKLGNVPGLKSRITMFSSQKHCGRHLWQHIIIGCSQFGGLKSLKKFIFKKMFL